MASQNFDTINQYVKARVVYNAEIVGDYPNLAVRVTYHFEHYTTSTAWCNYDITYTFHNQSHTERCNFSVSGATDPCWVSSTHTVDLPMATNRSVTHSPGVSISGDGFTFSGILNMGTYTVDLPSDFSGSVSEITSTTARVKINTSNNPHNGYEKRIFVRDITNGQTSHTQKTAQVTNNLDYTITGLTPLHQYEIHMETYWRSGNSFLQQNEKIITTLSDQAKMYIKVNGAWKKGKVFVKVNGTWKKAKAIYTKQNGTWKKGE